MRSGPRPHTIPARWVILKTLADATEPLDLRQLMTRAGTLETTTRNALVRPRRARWVTAVAVGMNGSSEYKLIYTITPLGREALADHLKETTP